METYSIREVIEQAVQTEKQGFEFYKVVAEKSFDDEKLKNLFETLASREQQHERMFSRLMESNETQIPDNWGEVSKYMRAIVESEFFLGNNKALPSMEQIQTAPEAVRFAIAFEKETLLYFLDLRNLVSDKETVDMIINEEKKHIIWLNDYKRKII